MKLSGDIFFVNGAYISSRNIATVQQSPNQAKPGWVKPNLVTTKPKPSQAD